MSSKRAIRRKQCKSKTRYDTQGQAQRALNGLRRNTGDSSVMTAYHCRWCGGFHFGHTPYRVRLSMGARP